jgi:regulator of protease activity HflC (stomatin/prohibitin superfamily)
MAANAKTRRDIAWEVEEAERQAAEILWHAEHDREVDEVVAEWTAEITEEDARAGRESPPCACVGPPPELHHIIGAPCRCLLWGMAYEKRRQELGGS